MACILHNDTQDLFKFMALQIELEKKEKEGLVEQLQTVNDRLEQIRKILAHKNHVIDSLEVDLIHVVKQLEKLQTITKTYDHR